MIILLFLLFIELYLSAARADNARNYYRRRAGRGDSKAPARRIGIFDKSSAAAAFGLSDQECILYPIYRL